MNYLLNNFRRCFFHNYKQFTTITENHLFKNFATIKALKQSNIIQNSFYSSINVSSDEILTKVNDNLEESEDKVLLPKELFNLLKKEYENSIEKNNELKEKYMRSIAETENLRNRMQKIIDETKIFAVQNFCKDLLEVADILNLALDSLEKNNELSNENLTNIFEGIKMTKTVLHKTFSKHGLSSIYPEGAKFDPNFHDAIYEVPKEHSKYEPGYVHHVMKIGYCLHNRPIRPAQVSVVKQ